MLQGGDANGNGNVSGSDLGLYNLQTGTGSGYKSADFNLTGAVSGSDLGIYNLNTGGAPQPNLNL